MFPFPPLFRSLFLATIIIFILFQINAAPTRRDAFILLEEGRLHPRRGIFIHLFRVSCWGSLGRKGIYPLSRVDDIAPNDAKAIPLVQMGPVLADEWEGAIAFGVMDKGHVLLGRFSGPFSYKYSYAMELIVK